MMKNLFFLLILFSFLLSKSEPNVNFENLTLKELIKITSKVLHKNILVNTQIKGKIDFYSTNPLNKKELLILLKSSLNNNGYDLIDKKFYFKVVKKDKKELVLKTIFLKNLKVNKLYENLINIKDSNFKDTKFFKTTINNSITFLGSKKSINYLSKYIKKIDEQNYKTEKITQVISLKNIESKNLVNILKSYLKSNKIKDIFVSSDSSSNSLILIGNKKSVILIKDLIHKLDKDETQIYLEAKILEINRQLLHKVGFKYGLLSKKANGSSIYTLSSSLNSKISTEFNISKIGLPLPTLRSSLALGAVLSLLEKNYALKIVSEPSILSINNKTSSIYIGETISLQNASTTTSGGNTSYSYKREDVGLKLKIKPRVSEDINKVRIDILAVLEGIKNTSTNDQPDTTKKSINTSVIVRNGESIILGGLIENKNEKIDENIPFLSSIPIVGNLFKYKNTQNIQKNLVIIITPYIVPTSKDLTYVINQLAKLKTLENKILNKNF